MRKGGNTPDDIITDILLRLPSATVLRFKIVSKTWYALISDPFFINLHSKRVSPNPKILLSIPYPTHSELHLLDYESPYRSLKTVGPLSFPREKPDLQSFKIIGSSFGLVCVATDYCGSFYIWNPTTRESRKVPNLGLTKIDHYDYLHGLGYDPVSNDFRVVISLYPDDYVPNLSITYNVYSLKTNSWKEIASPFQYYYNPSKFPSAWQISTPPTKTQFQDSATNTLATVLNGVFHWLVRVPNETNPHIIAFDSTRETFTKLRLPEEKIGKLRTPAASDLAGGIVTLLEHKGCLCLFCPCDWSRDGKEIWMMKEYGDHKSWIHLFSIFEAGSMASSGSLYRPVCITSMDEVVIHTRGLIRWSSGRPKFRSEKTGSFWADASSISGAVLVDETLVSLNDITHKGISVSKSNYFSSVLDLLRIMINCFSI